ncbi:MAG: hypothetical protein R2825_28645 [Saprospiraceae bacterium]
MKKTILIAVMLFAFSGSQLFAQSVLEKYDSETIYLSTYKYYKKGGSHRIGLMAKNLKKEMAISPNAMIEFGKYEKKQKQAILFWSAGILTFASSYLIDKEKEELRASMQLAGVVMFYVSFPLQLKATKHLNKSVWVRNRDVLK